MAWIESHQPLQRHPKTIRLAKLLKAPRVTVIGHLHCLWWWALDFAPGGSLGAVDDETIAEAAEWKRDPSAFVAALIEAKGPSGFGFLDPDRSLHDWEDYTWRYFAMVAANKTANKDPEHQRAAGKARAEKASRNPDGTFGLTSQSPATDQPPAPAYVQPAVPAESSHTSPTDLDLPTLTYQTNQDQPTNQSQSLAPAPRPRVRNVLFDALCETCGMDPAEVSLNHTEAKKVGVALSRILPLSPTPEDIAERGSDANWSAVMGEATKTPNAITSNWARLAPGSSQRRPASTADRMLARVREMQREEASDDALTSG